MPFAGFDDWDECVRTMTDEEGHDMESAESICGALQAEAKADNGNPEELLESLKQGAGLIADVGVDLVSGVDVPAIDSRWVAMKSADGPDDTNYRVNAPLLKADGDSPDADEEAKRVTYAPAMIPRELDKEGDVAATPTVEKAAHDFLTQNGGVDTDHSLIDGEGDVIESWVLKDERSFELPSGGSESYPAGTWMVGIKWGADAWSRIKSGELTGLSIYGMADHVALKSDGSFVSRSNETAKQFEVPFADETVVHVVYESETAARKASEAMGLGGAIHGHELDGMSVHMPGETHDDFVQAYNEDAEMPDADGGGDAEQVDASLAETAKEDGPCWDGYTMVGTDENGDPRCVPDDEVPDADFSESLTPAESKEAAGTTKSDATGTESMGEQSDDLADRFDSLEATVETIKEAVGETESKQPGQDRPEFLSQKAEEIAEREDVDLAPDQILSQLKELFREDGYGDEEDDEDEMDEMESAASKRAGDANLEKGGDGSGTAAEQTAKVNDATGTGSGVPSYAELAAGHDGGD